MITLKAHKQLSIFTENVSFFIVSPCTCSITITINWKWIAFFHLIFSCRIYSIWGNFKRNSNWFRKTDNFYTVRWFNSNIGKSDWHEGCGYIRFSINIFRQNNGIAPRKRLGCLWWGTRKCCHSSSQTTRNGISLAIFHNCSLVYRYDCCLLFIHHFKGCRLTCATRCYINICVLDGWTGRRRINFNQGYFYGWILNIS